MFRYKIMIASERPQHHKGGFSEWEEQEEEVTPEEGISEEDTAVAEAAADIV